MRIRNRAVRECVPRLVLIVATVAEAGATAADPAVLHSARRPRHGETHGVWDAALAARVDLVEQPMVRATRVRLICKHVAFVVADSHLDDLAMA